MDVSKFTIGRPVRIKTDDDIYDSYISAITLSDENFVYFKSGSLRITLLDKLKSDKNEVGNKLDVTGGTIKGDLKVTKQIYMGESKVLTDTTRILTVGTDLNDYKTSGTYYFTSAYAPINIPAGVNGWLVVITLDDETVKQIWYRNGTLNSNDFQTYVRTCGAGEWSNWRRLCTVEELFNEVKALTITSNEFEVVRSGTSSYYVEVGNFVFASIYLKTMSALTAGSTYSITTNLPTPLSYVGVGGYVYQQNSPAMAILTPDKTLQIKPYTAVTTGREFAAQLFYFKG